MTWRWDRVADNKEATEPRVPFGNVEVITSIFYGHHHDLIDRFGIL
jgi:hypothetical protein